MHAKASAIGDKPKGMKGIVIVRYWKVGPSLDLLDLPCKFHVTITIHSRHVRHHASLDLQAICSSSRFKRPGGNPRPLIAWQHYRSSKPAVLHSPNQSLKTLSVRKQQPHHTAMGNNLVDTINQGHIGSQCRSCQAPAMSGSRWTVAASRKSPPKQQRRRAGAASEAVLRCTAWA